MKHARRCHDHTVQIPAFRQPVIAVLLAVAVWLFGACNGTPPTPSTLTVNLNGTVFPLGVTKNGVDESFTFFAGTTVDSFSLTLAATGLTTDMKLEVRPGDGGTPLQTVSAPGTVVAEFPGNVGVLRLVSTGLQPSPGIRLLSMTMHSTGAAAFSALTTSLTGQVTSMPLTLNRPVEIAFPVAQSPKSYFMAVTGVGGKTLDIVVDGAGRVLFSTDPQTGFVFPEGGTGEGGFFTATGAASTITLSPPRDTLFLTVASAGVEGHTRVSVNEATRVLSLRAKFISLTAITAAQTAAVTAAMTTASTTLYQATMGRVRIGSLTLLSRINSSDGSSAQPDIYILPPTPAGAILPSTTIPAGTVVFDMAPPPGAATSGVDLAAALLNAKFSLPFEPRDADGTITCPNSLMANPGMSLPTLCWRSNHNPFGSNGLGAVAPRSAWENLAGQVGLPAPPNASPAHLLRTLTAITFPIATTVVP